MTAAVDLTLPFPPSVNAFWQVANGHIVSTSRAKEYKKRVAEYNRGRSPLFGRCEISVLDIFPRVESSDIDGVFKCLFDSLNGIVWLDDNQVKLIQRIEMHPPSEKPRVHLRVLAPRFATDAETLAHAQVKAERTRKRRETMAETRLRKRVEEDKKQAFNSDWKRLARPATYRGLR